MGLFRDVPERDIFTIRRLALPVAGLVSPALILKCTGRATLQSGLWAVPSAEWAGVRPGDLRSPVQKDTQSETVNQHIFEQDTGAVDIGTGHCIDMERWGIGA